MKVKMLKNIPVPRILDLLITTLEVIHLQQHTEFAHE